MNSQLTKEETKKSCHSNNIGRPSADLGWLGQLGSLSRAPQAFHPQAGWPRCVLHDDGKVQRGHSGLCLHVCYYADSQRKSQGEAQIRGAAPQRTGRVSGYRKKGRIQLVCELFACDFVFVHPSPLGMATSCALSGQVKLSGMRRQLR